MENCMKKALSFILLTAALAFPIEGKLNGLFSNLLQNCPAKGAMAILPFSVSGGDMGPEAGRMVSEYAVAFFAGQPAFKLVERADFHRVIEELEFSQSDLADEQKSLSLGKLLAAEYILTGSITQALGKRMVSARIINSQTGEVVKMSTATVSTEALTNFYQDALGERAGVSGPVFRSALLPGWGLFFLNKPMRGSIHLGATGVALGGLIWSIVDFNDKNNYADEFNIGGNLIPGESIPDRQARKDNAIGEAGDAETIMLVMSGITAAAWGANMLDTWLVGKKEAKRVRKFYFSLMPGTKYGIQPGLRMVFNID